MVKKSFFVFHNINDSFHQNFIFYQSYSLCVSYYIYRERSIAIPVEIWYIPNRNIRRYLKKVWKNGNTAIILLYGIM